MLAMATDKLLLPSVRSKLSDITLGY